MNGHGSIKRDPHGLLQRVVLGLVTVGTLLGVATVIVAYRVMGEFHNDLLRRPDTAHDSELLEMIAHSSNIMLLILALIVLVAALNIAAGFLTIWRSRPRRAG
jgi:ABC-type lipoprotein release transport system permease subunit